MTALTAITAQMYSPGDDRRDFLGASDFAALLGLSRWKTRQQLFLEKVGELEPSPSSLRQEVGLVLEKFVLRKAAQRVGAGLVCDIEYIHPAHPWLRVHLDAEALLPSGEFAVMEAKTCAFAKRDDGWGAAGSADIPSGYVAQVQVQMLVARACGRDIKRAFVPCLLLNRLNDENNPQVFEVPFEPDMAAGLLSHAVRFWSEVTNHLSQKASAA